ncbi:hypothetical protein ACRARG_20695 [Pseudooceanicola sp. C21-150M6]|uniref:hypothetical protein n=1 Tax=Pseudooceanicola sp. C21-150M6 TaxID=3434355 RepID=UPI003D7F8AA3
MTRTLILVALLIAPGLAQAQSSCAEKHQAAACAEGTSWNTETGTCETIVSS